VEYQFSKHVSFFVNSRNVFNEGRFYQRYRSDTPTYAKYYFDSPVGVQTAIGVKGTF
jgi:hypothetical protein